MTDPAIPAWRRMTPDSLAARGLAAVLLGAILIVGATVIGLPLLSRWDETVARAEGLDRRTAALMAATEARQAEAAGAVPDAALLAGAAVYLDRHAPERSAEAGLLDLVSSLRLIAEATAVNLATVTPLDGRTGGIPAPLSLSGIAVSTAEARIVTDHAGLVRFLAALEAAQPTLRATTLDITARSAAVTAEDDRLSVALTVSALSRVGGGE